MLHWFGWTSNSVFTIIHWQKCTKTYYHDRLHAYTIPVNCMKILKANTNAAQRSCSTTKLPDNKCLQATYIVSTDIDNQTHTRQLKRIYKNTKRSPETHTKLNLSKLLPGLHANWLPSSSHGSYGILKKGELGGRDKMVGVEYCVDQLQGLNGRWCEVSEIKTRRCSSSKCSDKPIGGLDVNYVEQRG